MPTTLRVDVERVRELRAELDRINALPLHNLHLYEGGRRLKVHDALIHNWELTGLNNVDFILTESYRKRERERPEP